MSEQEQELIDKESLGLVSYDVQVDYDYWNSGIKRMKCRAIWGYL